MNKIKSAIRPFVWRTNLIKEDPIKALRLEEKREKIIPKDMMPS